MDIFGANVRDVALVLRHSNILGFHITLNEYKLYLAVAGMVAALIHIILGPLEELVGTNGILPILGSLLWLEVVVVGMAQHPIRTAHLGGSASDCAHPFSIKLILWEKLQIVD